MKRIIWSRFFRRLQSTRGVPVTRKTNKQLVRSTVLPRLEHLEDRTLLSGQTFTVDLLGDAGNKDTTDPTGLSGDIRYCINQADLTPNAGSTIQFDTNALFKGKSSGTIKLSHGELAVSNTMTISGPGEGNLTIDGGFQVPTPTNPTGSPGSRVFNITSNDAVVTISGMTITGGDGSPLTSNTPGNQGGDIFNGGNLTLQNDVVKNGYVVGAIGGPPARGGGIFNAEGSGTTGAILTLDGTTIEGNTAQGADGPSSGIFGFPGGPGGFGAGGGIYNDSNASLTLKNGSAILNNKALGGSGGNGLHGLNAPNATIKNEPGPSGSSGGAGGAGGAALGGGIYNNSGGSLSILGDSAAFVVLTDNQALGGTGGNGDYGGNGGNGNGTGIGGPGGAGGSGGSGGSAIGAGLFNSGSIVSVEYAQFAGNQAKGAGGGTGAHGGKAGNGGGTASGGKGGGGGSGGIGGDAKGGAIYSMNGSFTIDQSQFLADASGLGNRAIGGDGNNASNGGQGGNGGGKFFKGGSGGSGGAGGAAGLAQGGAVDNLGGDLTISNTTSTASLAQGGTGGIGSTGGIGGTGGGTATGGPGAAGGAGGAGGAAQGGGVFNSGSALTFNNYLSSNSRAAGGAGNTGGAGGVGGVGGNSWTGGGGGGGGIGGAGGDALGGGFFVLSGALSVTNSQFISNGTGNVASSGSGGIGGAGGTGGKGGNGTFGGAGGVGGAGASGGAAGIAEGGAGGNTGKDTSTVTGSTFSSNLVQAGNGGAGGLGGNGGKGGDGNPFSGAGGHAGSGGSGGSGSTAQGGALVVIAGSLDVSSSTFGGSTSLANQVIGGNGGTGGTGGVIGQNGGPGNGYSLFLPPTTNGGHGGRGGDGTTVLGGAVSVHSGKPPSEVSVVSDYPALDFNTSGGYTPPDTQGGAGPNEFIESVNSTVGIFKPRATGTTAITDSMDHFFFTAGGLTRQSGAFLGDAVSMYDSLHGVFVVGDLYTNETDTGNYFVFAVSKSNNPATLTAADWNFYEIDISEPGVFLQDYPGNLGYNKDALLVDFNTFGSTAQHTFVNAISMSALTSGAPLTLGTNLFQSDYAGILPRPATMTDSKAGDPMWFVESDGAGGQAIPPTGANTITVLKMTNVLSGTPTYTPYTLNVNQYYQETPPLQPDGSSIFRPIDSRILNADETNGMLVAAQSVSNAAGTLDNVQWYEINVSDPNNPTLAQQGDVTGGAGVYDVVPAIAVNSKGDIGMTFMQSGTSSAQFLSMYVTGRLASDPVGTMQPPVLVQAGTGDKTYVDPFGRLGDMAGINIDPADGSFWAVNEYATSDAFINWGTAVAHFTVIPTTITAPTVTIDSGSTFIGNTITGGTGGDGGPGGLSPLGGALGGGGVLGGDCGTGGDGGSALGGGVSLYDLNGGNATLTDLTVSSNSATGGVGGNGGTQLGSNSGAGGNGGSVQGGGISTVNYNVNKSATASSLTLDQNSGTGGDGGVGGTSSLNVPDSSAGGNGGNGGSVVGGGFSFVNTTNSGLTFSLLGGSASNNQMTGGAGGTGGNAGTDGHDHILGGSGGNGGQVQGGGLYLFSSKNSLNTANVSNMTLADNSLVAGAGGPGGAGASATSGTKAGAFASGGDGGDAQGGGLFNDNLDAKQVGALTISSSLIAGNQLTSGNGALGGTGTTSNGGPGGSGGNGGNVEGGGVYGGNNTTLTAVNTTIGGLYADPTQPSNVLTAGSGGAGNNAGTPGGVPKADGGNGGNGGSVEGGGVFIPGGSTLFVNDTIVNNQAVTNGLHGASGSGAGAGGAAGKPGSDGTSAAGGYFAAASSTNNIGNTILGGNAAATAADASGAFTSEGGNFITSATGYSGLNTGTGGTDYLATMAQLNLGPLLNNGGPTLTDALIPSSFLIPGSFAIDKGNDSLITTALFGSTPTDQRGPGFQRTFGTHVDAGAFEFQTPIITLPLNPSSAVEGSGSFTLIIPGTSFEPGAVVSFGGTILTPSSITNSQLTVTVPGSLIPTDGTVSVMVENPDGSGVAGQTVNSAAATFTITEAAFSLVNPGDQTSDAGDAISLPIAPTAPDTLPDVGNFQATGLPPGLSIDPQTGIISGSIEGDASGTFNVTITANDGPPAAGLSTSISFKWVVNPFLLTYPGPQTNNEGDTITPLPITTTSGISAFNYSATGLPLGLSIDPNTGIISGTIDLRAGGPPQLPASGVYSVTVTAITAGPNPGTANVKFSWTVNDTTPPLVTTPADQKNFTGDVINLAIQSTDADTFSATGLPTGLSIDPTTGVISGTIATGAQGNYITTVTASDNGNDTPVTFNWVVLVPFGLKNPGDQTNDEGDNVVLQMAPVPGYTAANYSASGLPTGLSIDSTTGLISGTIDLREGGSYTTTVRASGNQGQLAGTTFNWTVIDTTAPVLTSPGTQINTAGDFINHFAIQAVDAEPGTFTATGLPPGLTIDPNTGVISGQISPTISGNFTVTVQASDSYLDPNKNTVVVYSEPMSFLWSVTAGPAGTGGTGGSPPPPPPGIPPGTTGLTSNLSILSVQNQYPGLVQMETVVVGVTNPQGFPVNEGIVTFQVNGQTVVAPVINGVAVATIATGLFDFSVLTDLLFAHPVTASYSDSSNIFTPSGAGQNVSGIWIDFLMSLLAIQLREVTQFQVT